MPIKSFRGRIKDGGIDTIVLHTNDGSTGYQIKKVQCVPADPGTTNTEHVFKIFKIQQTTATGSIDFSDQTLLGVAYYQDHVDSAYPGSIDIVFDNMTFNQDIYITHTSSTTTGVDGDMNYYIELEQIKLDLNENTVATLKDIRNIEASSV